MRLRVLLFAMVCACAVAIGTAAPAPQDQDDVRGAFLTSRPKNKAPESASTSKPSRRRPKTTIQNDPGKAPEKKPNNPTGPGPSSKPSEPVRPVNSARIGLGMTLFTRDSNGLAVRVDPEHVFRKGDRVRVLLETNSDGYLYIFNTTDDGPATLIYPDVDLDEAGNYLQAHVPFEIPSSSSTEERLRWFAFDEVAGTEHLFFVFTREPLSGVPIDDDLIAFCRESKERCPIKPSSEVWAAVEKHRQEPLRTDKTKQYGKAETAGEQDATARGFGLAKDDPQPSLVMMASLTRPTLVATLDLIHK